MKKRLKSIIGIILAVALCLSIAPIPALAGAMQADTPATEQPEAAQTAALAQEQAEPTPSPVVEDPTEPALQETPEPTVPDAAVSETPDVDTTPDPSMTPPPASPTTPSPEIPRITPVEPELLKVVSAPLVSVVYYYYDPAQTGNVAAIEDYVIQSSHAFYALARTDGDSISIAANKYPDRVPVGTDALRLRVLRGGEDITSVAGYNANTGTVSLPAMYLGHEITVAWYCPATEIIELPVKITTSIYRGGVFTNTAEEITVASNAGSISVPMPVSTGLAVSQNGVDLPGTSYGVSGGVLNISAAALGGELKISAYMPSRQTRGMNVTRVTHKRSADQIYYGYYTSYYTANGNTAFCLDPNASGLNSGTYDISSYLQRGRDDALIKIAYYLYGGPGYDAVKSRLFSDPDSLVSYALCHAAAAYVYLNDESAFRGIPEKTTQQLKTLVSKVSAYPMPPAGFDAFLYNVGSSASQAMMGWDYTPTAPPPPTLPPTPPPVVTGSLEIIKVSDNTEFTGGNNSYSLAGAIFNVYNGSGQMIGSIVTDSGGRGRLDGIEVGQPGLYAVEVQPPKGYTAASSPISFAIVPNQTTTVTVGNKPQNDPIGILLQKLDADTDFSNPQGNAGLAGAEFTVRYYKGLYTGAGQLSGLTPARTWVVRTDANGAAFLNPAYLVSGDPFYYAGNSDPTLPLGTVTVQETKAPVGYLINNTLFIRQITSNGVTEHVHTYNAPNVEDDVVRGGVAIEKWDAELRRAGGAQGDATLAGSVLEIYNRSTQSVVVAGQSCAPGALVYTMTTDATGTASTANDLLPFGQYEIIEKTPPNGYLNTGVLKQSFEIVNSGVTVILKTADTAIQNDVIRGGVEIEKWDAELNRQTVSQGDAVLSGAVFEIYNRGSNSVLVNGVEYAPGAVVHTITTDADGRAGTDNDLLPYSTYEIVENSPPEGYLNTGVIRRTFQIREDGGVVSLTSGDTAIKNDIIRGGVEIEKWDLERNAGTLRQGDAVLAGSVLEIWNRSAGSVLVDGVEHAPDTVVHILTTDADGRAETSNDLLPYGSYEIIEKTPPTGYRHAGKIEQSFQIRENGAIISLTDTETAIKNAVVRGGVRVEKWDHETGKHEPQGGATLEGAVIEIVNRSVDSVLVEEKLYGAGEVVHTMTTDKTGTAVISETLLPYGTYEAREISPPEGYLATGMLSRTFEIREHGIIVELNTAETAIRNNPIRGDLKGVKITEGDAGRVAGVRFKLTSKTTGESHVIVTDRNGQIDTSSSWNPHSQNTNRGETDKDGVWFGKIDKLSDELGALLYGTYLVEELPGDTNKDKELLSFEASVYRHMTVVDLGTITNEYTPAPAISTTAMDQETTANSAYTSKATTIVDTVYYSGLKTGKEYTLTGTLMDKSVGNPLLVQGKEITAETKFKASSESGSVTMKFVFDSGALRGKSVVVFESLKFNGDEIAVHADIGDTGQTVTFRDQKIRTSAAGTGGEKTIPLSANATIVDTVAYDGLTPGETYTVKGTLMDKASSRPLLAQGKEVVAETTFKAETASGTVKVNFVFDASGLSGKSVVIFETLLYKGQEIAAHSDIADSGQTVAFTTLKIGTSAGGRDRSKSIPLSGNAVIVDVVTYSGLTAGETYTLKGVLMDKSTGKPLPADGREITAETVFKAASASGTSEVVFTFDATALAGKTAVVFESLVYQGKEIAVHTDINDIGQTVTFQDLKIGTQAKAGDGGKKIPLSEKAMVTDTVSYSGLTVGETYILKGVLMDKATGRPLLVGGKEVRAETTFAARTASGSMEVVFTFDSTALAGKTIVVFESLERAGKEIAAHADINDAAQTVTAESKPGRGAQTGRDGLPFWLLIAGLVAIAVAVMLMLCLKRREGHY